MEPAGPINCPTCGHEIRFGVKQPNEPVRCVCGSIIQSTTNTQFTRSPISHVPQSLTRLDEEQVDDEHPDIKAPPIDPDQGFCLIFAALSVVTTCGPPAGFVFGYRTYRIAERLLNSMQDGSINSYSDKMIRVCWWLGIVAMTVNSILVSIFVIWIALGIVGSN